MPVLLISIWRDIKKPAPGDGLEGHSDFLSKISALLGLLFSLGYGLSCRDHRPSFSLTSATQLLGLEYKSCSFSFRCLPQQPRIFSMTNSIRREQSWCSPASCPFSFQPLSLGAVTWWHYLSHDVISLLCWHHWACGKEHTFHGLNVKYQAGPTDCCEAAPTVIEFFPIQQLWGLSLQSFRWLQPELFTICMLLPCAHTRMT